MYEPNRRRPPAGLPRIPLPIVALALLVAASPAAAEPAWVSIGPDGGDLFGLEVSPSDPSTMYALSFLSVFRTTDGATSWAHVHEPAMGTGLLALAFDPVDATHLYLGTGGTGVWESPDSGDTWTTCTTGLPSQPATPQLLYPVASLVSLPNGDLVAGLLQVAGEVDPPAWIYRSTDGCAFAADDTGISITATGLTQKIAALLTLDPNDQLFAMVHGAGVHTYQAGAWVSENGNLPADAIKATFLAHDPLNASRLLLGTERDWIYETLNAGVSWSAVALPVFLQSVPNLPLVYDIAIDPSNPDFVYALAHDANTSGETPIFTASLNQPVGGRGYLTANGGVDWPILSIPAFARVAIDSSQTVSTDLTPFGVTLRSKDWHATSYGDTNFFQSTDGLETVDSSNSGLASVLVNNVWVHPDPPAPNSKMLFTAAEEGMSLRIDAGPGWDLQRPTVSTSTIYTWSFANDPADSTLLYYATGHPARLNTLARGVYRTDLDCFGEGCPAADHLLADVGVWKVVTTPLQPLAVYAATQEEGVMTSGDAGATWAPMNGGLVLPVGITDIALDGAGDPMLASSRTSNGDITANPPQPWLPDDQEAGTVYRFAGGAWSASQDISAAAYGLASDPTDPLHVLAATAVGIYETVDGGVSWTQIYSASLATDVLIDPLTPTYFYAGSREGVLRSTDGGTQWHTLLQGLYQPFVLTLDADPGDGTLYAGTLGGSAFELVPDANPQPEVSLEPASLVFPLTTIGFPTDLAVTLTNAGEADLTITSITPDDAAFTVVDATLPIVLTPLSGRALTVRFSPQVAGVVNANITFASDDPVSPSFAYPVGGEGRDAIVPLPDVTLDGSDGPLTVPSGAIVSVVADLSEGDFGGQDADFWLRHTLPDGTTRWLEEGTGWIDSVTPVRLRAGPIFDLTPFVQATVAALASGEHTLLFAVDDNDDGTFDATWSDAALLTVDPAPPTIAASPASLDFGQVLLGASAVRGFGIVNTGEEDLVVSAIDIPIPELAFVSPPVFPLTVSLGSPASIAVRFTPSTEVLYATQLVVHSNDPSTPTLDLPVSGQGGDTNFATPDALLNGSEGPLNVDAGDPVTFSGNLTAGDFAGQTADFWVRQTLPDATTRWLVNGSGWVVSATPVLFQQSSIADQAPAFSTQLPDTSAGDHDLYFAVDDNTDGTFDGTWSDSETLTAVPEPHPLATLAAGAGLLAGLTRYSRRRRRRRSATHPNGAPNPAAGIPARNRYPGRRLTNRTLSCSALPGSGLANHSGSTS